MRGERERGKGKGKWERGKGKGKGGGKRNCGFLPFTHYPFPRGHSISMIFTLPAKRLKSWYFTSMR